MELTKLKCKCGHHYKVHASLEGCLACEGHYCGEGQVSILENAHAALETANADLLEALEKIDRMRDWAGEWKMENTTSHLRLRACYDIADEAIRQHKGEGK